MDPHLEYVMRIMEGTVEHSDALSDDLNENNNGWEWPVAESHQQHAERVALLRPIRYDLLHEYDMETSLEEEPPESRVARHGKGLSLNVSSGGMLLVMEHQPRVSQAVRIQVPTPITKAKTPTLAEVRWTRRLPFQTFADIYFVGLKFVL